MAEQEFPLPPTSVLGRGWSFPPKFDLANGEVTMTSDEEDIYASLKILFGTSLGERFLKPKYGLDMREALFEPMSTTFISILKDRIKHNILIYEPRIKILTLELDTSNQFEGRVSIILDYQILATNSRYNLVYPFYTSDSSELRGPTPFGI